jgi:protein O-GlcNAc transferase
MDDYIKNNSRTGIEHIESGIEFSNKEYILQGKDSLLNIFPLLEKGMGDYSLVQEKLIRAYTALCVFDPINALQYLEEGKIIDPKHPVIYNNLGFIYHMQLGNYQEAIRNYQKCFECDPSYLTAYLGIIDIYRSLRHHSLELEYCKKGIENCKESASIWNLYGLALLSTESYKKTGMKKIQDIFKHALTLCGPNDQKDKAKIYVNLGHAIGITGDYKETIECYIKSIQCDPGHTKSYQNILLNVHYFSLFEIQSPTFKRLLALFGISNESKDSVLCIKNLHKAICNEIFKDNTPQQQQKLKYKDTIRIGYVSSDLFDHAVSFFSNVLFEKYNKASFEVYVYSNNLYEMKTIQSLRCDKYTGIKGMTNEQAAQEIKKDKIDILIDLSGHTSGNRLDIFSLNPSPIQLTYAGYPNDIGMTSIKRISDVYSEKYSLSNQSIKLDRLFLCYTPKVNCNYTPKKYTQKIKKDIVFGCFAKLQKINTYNITIWKEILKRIPESKLVLKSKYFHDPVVVELWKKRFGDEYNTRVLFLKGTETSEQHMNLFNLIDIHLDTWPYSGTTISTECLYMNVPVLTYSPKPWTDEMNIGHVERVTGSILNSMKLNDMCIASSTSEYIKKAMSLSEFIKGGGDLKVREKFLNSEISDSKDFIIKYEQMLTELYNDKC